MAWFTRRGHRRAESKDSGLAIPPRAAAARAVSVDQALTLATTYRAFGILATAVSQITMGVWRGDEQLDPTPSIVRTPDPDLPGAAFYELTTTSLAATGNAFWRVWRNGDGAPIACAVLPAAHVAVDQTRNGDLRYGYDGRTYTPREIRHLQLMRVPGRRYGLGPIQAAAAEMRGAIDLRDYASTWFTDAPVAGRTYLTDQALTTSQAEEWKAALKQKAKPTEPLVLGNGLKPTDERLDPAAAQFLESRQFSTAEQCRLFGIPPTYMGVGVDGGSDTYSNQEQADIWFVRYTLMQYLREIEMAMSSLLARGQEARYKIDALLRTDTKTRYEAHQLAINMGLYSPEHAQRVEGLPTYTPTPREALA